MELLKHDIASAYDEACRLYYENTPTEVRSATGLRDAMNWAYKAVVKDKKTKYEKMLSITNPKHTPQFLAEVIPFIDSCSPNSAFLLLNLLTIRSI